jgi:hypothetical protein
MLEHGDSTEGPCRDESIFTRNILASAGPWDTHSDGVPCRVSGMTTILGIVVNISNLYVIGVIKVEVDGRTTSPTSARTALQTLLA